VKLAVPARLASVCARKPESAAWLERLPEVVARLRDEWALELGPAFDHDGHGSWVAPARRADASPAVLKVELPHFEAEHGVEGLRFWDGDPFVRLLAADREANAMLLERCEPGTDLRTLPEPEQDVVIAALLRRIWRPVPEPHPFRPLSVLADDWGAEALELDVPGDDELRREGIRLFMELPATAPEHVLLATDLHAGNVLRAGREPWLAIDPKPFVGDPAYDATQHLMNCTRLMTAPDDTVRRLARLLELDEDRLRLWTFARLAVETERDWGESLPVARALAG
jgi:streptomycin 6-kinase